MRQGLIFDIQGHSVHDGPGTRTAVFMSGCPLKCAWCANPEGIPGKPVLLYRESKCGRCGRCRSSCPHDAVLTAEDGRLYFDRSVCLTCRTWDCLQTCYNEALAPVGRPYTVADLMRVFQRDRQFWGQRGGVTFTGGEPLAQGEFLLEALQQCRDAYIHTCVETSAHAPTDLLMDVLSLTDWLFMDIKHMDSAQHLAMTGLGNGLVLHNIEAVARADWDGFAVVRVPLVPDFNDSRENIQATAAFVRSIGLEVINLLPFHRLGESKYRQLGQAYACRDLSAPTEEALAERKALIEAEGLTCYIGSQTPF